MSFAITKVGAPNDVALELNKVNIQDDFGKQLRDVIAAKLSEPTTLPNVIVKLVGHSSGTTVNLTASIEPVW